MSNLFLKIWIDKVTGRVVYALKVVYDIRVEGHLFDARNQSSGQLLLKWEQRMGKRGRRDNIEMSGKVQALKSKTRQHSASQNTEKHKTYIFNIAA